MDNVRSHGNLVTENEGKSQLCHWIPDSQCGNLRILRTFSIFFRENNALKGLFSKMASANSIFYQVGARPLVFNTICIFNTFKKYLHWVFSIHLQKYVLVLINTSVRPKPKLRPKLRSFTAEIVQLKLRSTLPNRRISQKTSFFANFELYFVNIFYFSQIVKNNF